VLKKDYLKLTLSHESKNGKHVCLYRNWMISAFAIIQESPDAYQTDPYLYRIVQTPTGIMFVDADKQLVKIDDVKPGSPLFSFSEAIEADETWAPNIKSKIETTVGRLIVNQILLVTIFKDRIPFINKSLKVGDVESEIALHLTPTPKDGSARDPKLIYIDDYSHFVDRLQYISSLASLSNYSATRKNIVAPPGIEKYRSELVKEYGDRLKDPVILAEFEGKLKAYTEEHLKDDPSNGVFLSGKVKNIGYKRMFLDFGIDSQIRESTEVRPITQPLTEGWSTEPDHFASMMNGLRAGSYARGMETVKGGVTAKALLRSLSSFVITDQDCGSKIGLSRIFTDKNYQLLVSRYIQEGNKWILVTDEDTAKRYINKPVVMRSPLYCQSPKESFCKYCVGEKLALNPNGLSLAATDVSSVVLGSFMQAMHGTVLSTAHFDYSKHLT